MNSTTTNTQPLMTLKGISKSFDGRPILHHIDLAIRSNSITTIIGPNGAGKTTLLRILLGLETPSDGKISRRPDLKLGYVPQRFHKDPMLPLKVSRFLQLAPSSPKATFITNTLAEVGAAHLVDQSMNTLSGGELQRILLARALLNTPELLALDEPMQGVDLRGQSALYQLLSDIQQRRGCSILMVSHDLNFVMAATDQVICLNHHICCSGRPDDVRAHPEYVALFGDQDFKGVGIYSHHHDHEHGLDGEIEDGHDHASPHSCKQSCTHSTPTTKNTSSHPGESS